MDTPNVPSQDDRIPIKIMEWYTINTPDSDGSDISNGSDGQDKYNTSNLTYKILVFGKD